MFKRLIINNWRQFSALDIYFHPTLTVITGANGTGKTTVLNLLSKNIGWEPRFVSSFDENENGNRQYGNSVDDSIEGNKEVINVSNHPSGMNYTAYNKFGELSLVNGTEIGLLLPEALTTGIYTPILGPLRKTASNQEQKTDSIYLPKPFQPDTSGVFIHSHRPSFPYRKLDTIPSNVATRADIYKEYLDFSKKFMHNEVDGHGNSQRTATLLIKRNLAALAIYGEGNSAVAPNQSAKQLFDGYIKILKKALPPKLGFERIKVVMPEVLLCTKTGEFPLDAISGGISSIIDITWQLYLFYEDNKPFVALIDEPENHLHPELQKSFLGNLIKAFPNVQFIIATHNPLMISSQKESNVYMLDYDANNKVHSVQLDHVNRAGTSNAILRDALGVDSSMPYWAEEILQAIIERYQNVEITNDSLNQMRGDLEGIGLEDYIPNTIAKILGEK